MVGDILNNYIFKRLIFVHYLLFYPYLISLLSLNIGNPIGKHGEEVAGERGSDVDGSSLVPDIYKNVMNNVFGGIRIPQLFTGNIINRFPVPVIELIESATVVLFSQQINKYYVGKLFQLVG